MSETRRTELAPTTPSQANLGGLAVAASAEVNPFEVTETELTNLIPDLGLYRQESQKAIDTIRDIGINNQDLNRQERRKPQSNVHELNNFINSTLWFMTSFDSSEEAMEHPFFPNIRYLIQNEGIDILKTSSDDLRIFEKSRQQLAEEVSNIVNDDTKSYEQYTLLKAISYTDRRNLQDKDLEREFLDEELSSRTAIASALASYGAKARQKLEDNARAGHFDKYIAYDTLKLAMNNGDSNNDLEKLREFNAFCTSFGDQSKPLSSELAMEYKLAATLESWPATYRHVITKSRDGILERLDTNSRRIKRILNQHHLTPAADPEMQLYEATHAHSQAALKNVTGKAIPSVLAVVKAVSAQLGIEAPGVEDIIEVMRGPSRKSLKRPRNKHDDEALPKPVESVDTTETKLELVNRLERYIPSSRSCDNEIGEVIEQFLKSINSRSKDHQNDVKAILQYMERNPMLGHQKVQALTEVKVKIDREEKTVYRFRPQIVPGLSNGTSDWRVAFVVYDNEAGQNVIGLVGLYHKTNWDNFAKKIKNGMREHN